MSLREQFRGTGIAIVTPFLEDGTIDWEAYKKLIHFWIENKVEYLVVLGTTGESATIHGEEKQAVFSFVKNEVAGRLPLVAGIGGNDTTEVIEGFKKFNLEGYSAILSVSPYYNKPNQEGLFQHYKALNAATPLPIIMYNVPGRTGMMYQLVPPSALPGSVRIFLRPRKPAAILNRSIKLSNTSRQSSWSSVVMTRSLYP
jgi:4-hydroxy-tetrahydrodipicolinate synthase